MASTVFGGNQIGKWRRITILLANIQFIWDRHNFETQWDHGTITLPSMVRLSFELTLSSESGRLSSCTWQKFRPKNTFARLFPLPGFCQNFASPSFPYRTSKKWFPYFVPRILNIFPYKINKIGLLYRYYYKNAHSYHKHGMYNVCPSKLKYLQPRANFLKCMLSCLSKYPFFPCLFLNSTLNVRFPFLSVNLPPFTFPYPSFLRSRLFLIFKICVSLFLERELTMGTYLFL